MPKGKRNSDGLAPFTGRSHPRRKDISGQVFGDWTVLEFVPSETRKGGAHWLCRCACGTERVVRGLHLRRGNSRGCGCRALERLSESKSRHGHASQAGRTDTYGSWRAMLDRTRAAAKGRENYYQGVKVCASWDPRQGGGFENFLADLGWRLPGTSLDRINPFGNYEASNCRWASASEQAFNQRRYWKGDSLDSSQV